MSEPAVTYKFTTLPRQGANETPELLADLPLKGVTFSQAINEAGPWAATLPVEDPGVTSTGWLEATRINRTCMWIDIDGILVYGGRVLERHYHLAEGAVTLGGSDALGYLSQRWQALDYTEYTDPESHKWWELPGAPSTRIVYYMIKQCLEETYSLKVSIVSTGGNPPEEDWITASVPLEQHQPLASILTQIHSLSYNIGCDINAEVAYAAGVPTFFIKISYPRAGENPVGGAPIIDISDAIDLEYSEDGINQANAVIEQSGGGTAEWQEWTDGAEPYTTYHYPLLQRLATHPSLNPSGLSETVLQAFGKADIALSVFPLTAPKVTLPMFGTPSIFELSPIGLDTELWVPHQAGQGGEPQQNPRFPNGMRYKFRVSRIDCTIPDEGLPTMAVTLNVPPAVTINPPPEPY